MDFYLCIYLFIYLFNFLINTPGFFFLPPCTEILQCQLVLILQKTVSHLPEKLLLLLG